MPKFKPKEISLDDFVALAKKDVDTFKACWERERAKNRPGEVWPLQMTAGDWYAQYEDFVMYPSGRDSKDDD